MKKSIIGLYVLGAGALFGSGYYAFGTMLSRPTMHESKVASSVISDQDKDEARYIENSAKSDSTQKMNQTERASKTSESQTTRSKSADALSADQKTAILMLNSQVGNDGIYGALAKVRQSKFDLGDRVRSNQPGMGMPLGVKLATKPDLLQGQPQGSESYKLLAQTPLEGDTHYGVVIEDGIGYLFDNTATTFEDMKNSATTVKVDLDAQVDSEITKSQQFDDVMQGFDFDNEATQEL